MAHPPHRRDALRAAIAALALPAAPDLPPRPTRGVRAFRLVEAAGLRRSGYPIAATVPDAVGGRNFRLVRDGRPVPAQFRRVDNGPHGAPEVALDFLVGPGPMEVQRYEVHFGGPEVEPGPEPAGGIAVERRDGAYLVSQGVAIRYAIPGNAFGRFDEAGGPRLAYLKPGSSGLTIRSPAADGFAAPSKPGGVRSSVTRQGPLAVGLRFEAGEVADGTGMTLDLTFPHSKTWFQAAWTVDDPRGVVAGLGLDLGVALEGPPALVDFGAGTTVYGQARGDERVELVAGRAPGEAEPESGRGWVVRRGGPGTSTVQAASTAGDPRPAEGWAHVMDGRRCVALAVPGFGRSAARDKIRVEADGRARLTRDYAAGQAAPPPGPKSLAFTLHFVPMPVQVGAATSPQSILAPPRVEWDRPPDR